MSAVQRLQQKPLNRVRSTMWRSAACSTCGGAASLRGALNCWRRSRSDRSDSPVSSKPAAIPLFADAYLADTTHLSTEEHGAYLLLLMAAWRTDDCALPVDDRKLARIAKMSPRKWLAIRATVLEFWTIDGDRMWQKRLRQEHRFVRQKSEGNRKSAVARWNRQGIENKRSVGCDRISDRNAPPPPPITERNARARFPSRHDEASVPIPTDLADPTEARRLGVILGGLHGAGNEDAS